MSWINTFVVFSSCVASSALAQWQWTDENGRRVFSDQPPPAQVHRSRIMQQPAAPSLTVQPTAPEPIGAAPAPKLPTATVPQPSASDRAQQAQRLRAEAAEAARREAELERVAAMRADNCTRARRAQATLASGQRLARVNDKGEREILDDAERTAEGARLQAIIASDCASRP